MYRFVLAAFAATVLAASPALALSPLDEQPTSVAASSPAPAPDVRPLPRLRRVDRWRGRPYTRSENDILRREALDKRLVRSGEMPTAVSFEGEGNEAVRSEALDKRMPLGDFGQSPAPVTFNEGDTALRNEALDKRMPIADFGMPIPGLGF